MRSLLVIIDGLGDDPIPEWNGLAPFQYAEHKNMDELIRLGAYSEVSICEDDFIPESLSCILRLLGVQQQDFPTNRAYLELLAHDCDISEYEMVLRCNLVSVDENDMLVSFNGQGLSAKDMAEAAKACNGNLITSLQHIADGAENAVHDLFNFNGRNAGIVCNFGNQL